MSACIGLQGDSSPCVVAMMQPEPAADSQLEAWRMDDSDADQRCEHRHAKDDCLSVQHLASDRITSDCG
jgi:hypothetical protein